MNIIEYICIHLKNQQEILPGHAQGQLIPKSYNLKASPLVVNVIWDKSASEACVESEKINDQHTSALSQPEGMLNDAGMKEKASIFLCNEGIHFQPEHRYQQES